MWKKEDLQNKYVKLTSQEDYENVVKVLHEFGFKVRDFRLTPGYESKYPYLWISFEDYHSARNSLTKEIPIQQFYDYLKPKTIPDYVECVKCSNNEYVVGKIYKVENKKVRTEYGYLGICELPSNLKNHYDNADFKPSTKEAYDKQEYLVQYQEAAKPIENKSLVGRYFKILKNFDSRFEIGSYLTITRDLDSYDCYDTKEFGALHKDRIKEKEVELMPKGFNPNEVKSKEWIPKVGDWVFTDMYNIGDYSKAHCVKVIELDSSSSNQPNFKVKAIDGNEVWCYPKGFSGNNNYFLRKTEPHEIPKSNSMSKEELLILAKRKYPVGTKIKLMGMNSGGKFGNEIRFTDSSYFEKSPQLYVDGNLLIYDKNEWAEIVSLPQEEDLFDTKEGQEFLAQGITNKSKIDDNQVNLVIKQSESIILKRIENEINIKVKNLKTIKI